MSINKENSSKLEVRPANIYFFFYNDHNIQTGHHFSRKRKQESFSDIHSKLTFNFLKGLCHEFFQYSNSENVR